MGRYRKIVWNEGMLLTPHHFQQWDNYHEELVSSRIASLFPYEWGILDLQVNRESLSNGYFELLHCSGVMPDGLTVNIPQADPALDAIPIEGRFAPTEERLDVYLAIPAKRVGAANYQSNGSESGQTARYLQAAGTVIDETTGENEQQLAFGRGNFRLLFGDEIREGYSSVKIAELERTATGQVTLCESFIPPALNIALSSWLVNMHRQLIEILITKSSTLGERRRQRA